MRVYKATQTPLLTFEQCEDHQGVPNEPSFDVDSCKLELIYQQAIQPQ
jgi:hypothetical protein